MDIRQCLNSRSYASAKAHTPLWECPDLNAFNYLAFVLATQSTASFSLHKTNELAHMGGGN